MVRLELLGGVDQVDRGHSVHVLRNAGSNEPSNMVWFYLEYFLGKESMERFELLEGSTRSTLVIPSTSCIAPGRFFHSIIVKITYILNISCGMDHLELLGGVDQVDAFILFTSNVVQGQASHPIWFSFILNTS